MNCGGGVQVRTTPHLKSCGCAVCTTTLKPSVVLIPNYLCIYEDIFEQKYLDMITHLGPKHL